MRRLIGHWVAGFAVAISCAGGVGASDLYLLPGDPENGQALHQARCTVCHETQFGGDGSGMYERSPRRVQSIEGLMNKSRSVIDRLGRVLTSTKWKISLPI